MTIPGGYVEFCQARGVSLHHPELWTDADRAAYRAHKLAWFIDNMKAFKAFGQWELMGREHTKERIREWLDHVEAPPPTRRYRSCPCHPFAPRLVKPGAEMPHGLKYIRAVGEGRA